MQISVIVRHQASIILVQKGFETVSKASMDLIDSSSSSTWPQS